MNQIEDMHNEINKIQEKYQVLGYWQKRLSFLNGEYDQIQILLMTVIDLEKSLPHRTRATKLEQMIEEAEKYIADTQWDIGNHMLTLANNSKDNHTLV